VHQYLQVHCDVMEAFPGICRRLCRVLAYKRAGLVLYDSDSGNLRLHVQAGPSQDALPEGFLSVMPTD
jgi:hypothetical protein